MNRFRQLILLLLLLFVLPPSLFASSSPEHKVTLTNEEQAFLLAHPEIKFGIGEDWAPYVIRRPSGELEGFDVDMLAHINAVTGANIKLVAGPWKKTVEQAERHELDGLALTVVNRERGENFLFTDSYISTYPAFVVSSSYPENIEQIDNLNGKTVAILSGHKFYQTLLSAYPQITILEKPSETEVVRSIITGEATAAIVATTSFDKHFKKFGRSIRLAYIATDRPLNVLYSIRKDWPELVGIINKGLTLLPVEQFNRSYYRWFGMEPPLVDTLNRPVFSDAEKTWLEQKHLVRVHVGNYMPYYSTDASHAAQGMSVDYLNLVAKRSGLQLKYVSSNSWSEALSAISEHRDIDLLPAAYITAERTKYLNFTTEYLQSPSVILTRDDSPLISSLDDLAGKTIAVERGYATTKWLAEKYPQVKQLTEETTTDALRALSSGKVDAFVGNLTVSMYISRTQGFTNLKVAAPSPFNADKQAMAIRGDWPELAGIINKTLETLTPEEHETIRSRWLPPVQYEYADNQEEIVKWVGGVGGISFIVIMVVVFWNKKLSEEITARKQSEEQLKNSEEKFRSITELSHVGIFLDDSEGKAIYINSRCAEIVGVPAEEALSLDWVQYLHPDDRDRVVNEWLTAVANKKPFKQEYRYVHSDGQVVWTLGETSPVMNSQGEVSLFIGTMVDITERKESEKQRQELESQLRQKYKMEAVGVMAGGMAHNFNNNLAIILGNLDLSKRKLPPQSEIGEFLDYARIATLRSRDLVKKIMTYSRKEIKSQTPLQLSLLIDETLSLLKSTIPSSVQLHQVVNPDCAQAYIQADASQIQECLLNLCNNAVHAMDEQGELFLRLERVALKPEDISAHYTCLPGNYLCLSVQDNGCGIPAEIQEKIFDPFFTTKELYEGTGMGLSTVQGIVEQHHGMIRVTSGIGQGTVFQLYFPVVDPEQKEGAAVAKAELQRGSERILYVDDDEMIANLNKRLLSEMGYQVTIMTDSVEALKHFSANVDSYDLVMTDQTMPELTGKELIQRIKQLRPELPSILCTGYSNKVNKEDARQAGISAFLMKPTDFVEMSQVIRDVLEKPSAM